MNDDILDRTPPALDPRTDKRLKYGPLDLQFGDLRMPKLGAGQRAPVVMFCARGLVEVVLRAGVRWLFM